MKKKRANGEGSIRRKPSGTWEGRYTQGIDPVTGKAIQKSVSAKTQMEQATGNAPDPEPPTTPTEAESGCKVIPFERVG